MPNSFSGVALSPPSGIAWAMESPALSADKTATATRSRNKIGDAAREFEATLLTKWLEEARHGCGGVPGGEEDEDGDEAEQSQIIDLGLKSLATALTKSGGIGIARVLCQELQVRDRAEPQFQKQDEFTIGSPTTLPKINVKKD